jgi:hypothetical protein
MKAKMQVSPQFKEAAKAEVRRLIEQDSYPKPISVQKVRQAKRLADRFDRLRAAAHALDKQLGRFPLDVLETGSPQAIKQVKQLMAQFDALEQERDRVERELDAV